MAAVLGHDVSVRGDNSILTFLIVGAAQLCEKIANSVHQSARKQNKRTIVHQCEVITQVFKDQLLLTTDFIILIINGETSHSVLEFSGRGKFK
ncbi:uncharacterized protein LOC141531784 isoform X1 [Cotesia typhae]|uniref:uncharacterized protein LOC141531784 isoform X1 n=1 Tax=Cotesia typhae TaxID=2053667 RepID=UPI003D693558